ncbi:hypothetical protein LX16_4495 [Stackebrandtia albiflava]|uniref:Uncharacterized protein n=1 Tax=Stackebrandtia albiflava TaxID=406432 RepID=A0A562URM6_9ACTN|nr:hypothetical protein [Stackebrandtia albiflava]TWJ08270.1 hypothetical protein LX16_4495 [Stackebrandtia albiflava]
MTRPSWLTSGARSRALIVTSPGPQSNVREAVRRLDDALAGFPGAVPGWFRALERLRYRWYVICVVVAAAALAVAFPERIWLSLLYGVGVGIAFAPLSSALARSVAHLQVRATTGKRAAQVITELAAEARPFPLPREWVDAVLGVEPEREHRVHLLAWSAADPAGGGSDGPAARELVRLWRQADPSSAAELDALQERLQGMARELRGE